MALVTRTYLTDDLDGSEDDVSTVRLALDKVSYEIDLSAVNEARLRDKLAKFVAAGTRCGLSRWQVEDGSRQRLPLPDPIKNRRKRFVSGPGPTGIRSLTVGVSRRQFRKRSAPLTSFRAVCLTVLAQTDQCGPVPSRR
jgi:hypothetical protein